MDVDSGSEEIVEYQGHVLACSIACVHACTGLPSVQSSEYFVDLYSPSACASWRDMNIFDDL